MKRKKNIYYLVVMLLMITLITGCSSKAKSDMSRDNSDISGEAAYDMDGGARGNGKSEKIGVENTTTTALKDEAAAEEPLASTSVVGSINTDINTNDKIIRTATMEVETLDFDKLIDSINDKIKKLKGYVESSEINGNNYYSDGLKYGNLVVRIPKASLDEFINTVYKTSNVVSKQEFSENITLEYVSVESHKKALEIEQERLLALLKKVEKLEDIITLETRLSSVRYELQSYETQLLIYDNDVDYSTVTLSIQEVERVTVVEETKQSVWDRMGTGLVESMYNIGNIMQDFLVWFVVNLPYLIIWGIIILVAALFGRKYYRKNVKNNAIIKVDSSSQEEKKES